MKRGNRLLVLVNDEELREISEFRWQHRVESQADAARQLIAKGLEKTKAETAATVPAE